MHGEAATNEAQSDTMDSSSTLASVSVSLENTSPAPRFYCSDCDRQFKAAAGLTKHNGSKTHENIKADCFTERDCPETDAISC